MYASRLSMTRKPTSRLKSAAVACYGRTYNDTRGRYPAQGVEASIFALAVFTSNGDWKFR